MGDVVITTSCLAAVRRCLPEAELYLAVREIFLPLVEGNRHLNGVIGIPSGVCAGDLAEQWRHYGWDAVAHLNPDPVVEEAVERLGVPVRIGYSRGSGERLTEWLPYAWKKRGLQHEALFNFDVLERFGVEVPEQLLPDVRVDAAAVAGRAVPTGGVLFHLASHGKKPRVPATFFAGLARRILEETELSITVVGVSVEDASVASFFEALGGESERLLNLAGKTTIAELAALCAGAALMVSRDSGPAHLAAGVGCPTLTFFINSKPLMSPVRWKPLGRRVEIYYKPVFSWPWEPPACVAWRIIRRFRVEEVMVRVYELLRRNPRGVEVPGSRS